jgi:hypothetical protein
VAGLLVFTSSFFSHLHHTVLLASSVICTSYFDVWRVKRRVFRTEYHSLLYNHARVR